VAKRVTEKETDLEKIAAMTCSSFVYDAPVGHRPLVVPGPGVGMVGPDGYVVAIANVAHPPLTLVDVDAPFTHASYATVLVQALLKAAPDLSVSESLDARWWLACCLWRHEAPEADY